MEEYQTQEERRIWLEKLAEIRWSKEETKDEEAIPCCPSCSTPYRDHLGLIGTCAKLQEIFALVETYRHYTDPEAARIMCEKIMELKGLQNE